MPRDLKIRLEKSRVRSLNFKIKEDTGRGKIPVSIDISYSYKYNYKEKSISSLIFMSTREGRMPFHIEIEYEGIFKLNKQVAKKKVEPFANINCPAILFPFLRECVADITRRAGLNPLILPTMNFVELTKKSKAAKAENKNQSKE